MSTVKQVGLEIFDSNGVEMREGDKIIFRPDEDSDWEKATIKYYGGADYPAFDLCPRRDWDANALSTIICEEWQIKVTDSIYNNDDKVIEW